MTTLRETLAAMPADERLEYALYCWEMMTGQDEAPPWIVGDAKLTAMQASIFALLKRRIGSLVARETLMSVLYASKSGADVDVSVNLVRVHIVTLRRKLAGQFNIRTVIGHGYVLEAVQERGTSANSEARMAASSSTTSASITSTCPKPPRR